MTRLGPAVVALGLLALTAACDRRPRRIVPHGAACTSPYDDTSRPKHVCGPEAACLLFDGPTYVCAKRCTTDADCTGLEPGLRCTHENGHGDARGCTRPTRPPP